MQVVKAGNFLAKQLPNVAALVDKCIPTVVALFYAIPHGERGRQRGPGKNLLFDIAYGLAHRVTQTKLVELDGGIHPYLAMLIMAALAWVGETLVMLEGTCTTTMTREVFNNMLLKESHNFDNYGLFNR